jgi:hypothetical protein
LFVGTTKHSARLDSEGFETWGHKKKEHEERKDRLINLFVGALRLKADSVLHPYNYEIVRYTPDMPFDRTMNVENVQEIQLDGNFDGRVIQACLQPAVFSYTKAGIEQDAPNLIPKVIVSSKNFSRIDNRRENGQLLVPAVVILKD